MSKPLDARQYRYWHRIRRLPRSVFVLASVVSAGAVTALHLLTSWWVGIGILEIGSLAALLVILIVTFAGAHAWTWSYMELRYEATRHLLCPHCGYHVGATTSARCPECGSARA